MVSLQGAGGAEWRSFGDWLGSIVDACIAGDVDNDEVGFIFLKS